MKSSFSDKIAQFFSQNPSANNHRLMVARPDGVVLYKNFKDDSKGAVGVLMSGAWQAAEAMFQMAHSEIKTELKFSFGTSSDGVTILKFKVDSKEYFIASLYAAEINPAKQKNNLNRIKNQLSKFLLNDKKETSMEYIPSEKMTENSGSENSEDRKSYLFNDISDAEIDSLFSPAGF